MTTFNHYASTTMKWLYKFAFLTFGLYNINWTIQMWSDVPKVPALLNKGMTLYSALCDKTRNTGIGKLKYFKYNRFLLALVLIIPLSASIAYIAVAMPTNFDVQAASNNASFSNTLESMLITWFPIKLYSKAELYLLSIIYLFITTVAETSWQINFFLMIAWVFYFRKMIQMSIQRIQASPGDTELLEVMILCKCLLCHSFERIRIWIYCTYIP